MTQRPENTAAPLKEPKDDTPDQPAESDTTPVEDRPSVGTTTPDAYPKDGPSGGGKPDYR